VPEKKLAPAAGTMPRYRLQEWLNFITSELHKGIGGLFNPAMPEEAKALMREKATSRLKWVDAQLEGQGLHDGQCVLGRRRVPVRRQPTGPATSASTSRR
jgi:glutathione S-transferase